MRVPCACKRFRLNPERANLVIEGVPRCSPWTCQKVKEHRDQGLAYPDALPEHLLEADRRFSPEVAAYC